MNFSEIVFYDYPETKIDADIQKLMKTGGYQPTFTGLVRAFLASEIRHFYGHFGQSDKMDLIINYIGDICNDKGVPDFSKVNAFLKRNDIIEKTELKEKTVRESFGSGYIHNYHDSKGKNKLVYFYDMVGNPFDTIYTFAHEMTHAMQDKNNYTVYNLDKKEIADYREIHANLTAATFMMVKALQTGQDQVIHQTTEKLKQLSSKMAHVMKRPELGIRYFDWKGLGNVLSELPDNYQKLLDTSGHIDWNRLYDYTEKKVCQMDYTPDKVQSAKKLLSDRVAPIWQNENCTNQTFFEQAKKHQGQNEIVDDFLNAFSYHLGHRTTTNKLEAFYQQLANPIYRNDRLFSASNNDIPNIAIYRKLYSDDSTRFISKFTRQEHFS